jgi:hypothetical protein
MIFVDCDEPGCDAAAVLWSGDPMKTEPIYTTPAGWDFNDEPRVARCPEHRKQSEIEAKLIPVRPRRQ